MKIAIGADSAGKPLLDVIAAHLATRPRSRSAISARSGYYADSPRSSRPQSLDGRNDRGILFCGTGIGVCISANKVPGIRAALTHDTYSAERAAKSNNAQIITMGARVIGPELAKAIVDKWLASDFDPAGPSAGNVAAIDRLDAGKASAETMQNPLLSYYGDDLTGSTDVMEALSLGGVSTVLFMKQPGRGAARPLRPLPGDRSCRYGAQ